MEKPQNNAVGPAYFLSFSSVEEIGAHKGVQAVAGSSLALSPFLYNRDSLSACAFMARVALPITSTTNLTIPMRHWRGESLRVNASRLAAGCPHREVQRDAGTVYWSSMFIGSY